jgi:hypothetical protein
MGNKLPYTIGPVNNKVVIVEKWNYRDFSSNEKRYASLNPGVVKCTYYVEPLPARPGSSEE